MLTEIQELLHAAVYITSSSPDHTCLRTNFRDERDTCDFGKKREHILIEETAAAALLHELQYGRDLAAAHDDPGLNIERRKSVLKNTVLDRVLVIEDQRGFVQHFQTNF